MRPPVLRAICITLVVMVSGSGCTERPSGRPAPASPGELSVMSFNLDRFAYADRDQDGQPDEFKPEAEIQSIVRQVASMRPDVMAGQEIGNAAALEILQQRISAAGHPMPHADFLPSSAAGETGLGVLSRYPIVSTRHATNLTYTIRDQAIAMRRGIQHVEIHTDAAGRIQVLNVQLKSKEFHPAGQTEMRRNESRLLARHISTTQSQPGQAPLVVCGDFGDSSSSAALRELTEHASVDVTPLPLADAQGDAWTSYEPDEEAWVRHQYIFADRTWMSRFEDGKSGILIVPDGFRGSRHRPLVAVFRAAGRSKAVSPDHTPASR